MPVRGPDPSSVRIPGPWAHRGIFANGIRLHVAECGAGPLVVLLHGFPEFWYTWRHQLPALAGAGYRVVAPDLRGYGDSDKPPRGYDLWTLAGDISGLIRASGETSAHVVGHDWGGAIGWTLAAVAPLRVRSLAVLGAPHPLAIRRAVLRDPRGQGRATARHAAAFQLPRLPERALRAGGGAGVQRLMQAWAGQRWQQTPDFAEAVARNRRAIQVRAVAHCSLEYFRWAARSQLRSDGRRFATAVARPPAVPVLQVHGTADPWLLPRTAELSARWAGPDHRFEVMPGVGHFPHQERPDEVVASLAAFLGRVNRPG